MPVDTFHNPITQEQIDSIYGSDVVDTYYHEDCDEHGRIALDTADLIMEGHGVEPDDMEYYWSELHDGNTGSTCFFELFDFLGY